MNESRQSHFFPETSLGKWSFGLIVAMPILFFVGALLTRSLYQSVPAGNTITEDIAGRPALALTMLAATTSGVGASFIGLRAIIRQKERSRSVYIATILGALLILFLFGEFAFPH